MWQTLDPLLRMSSLFCLSWCKFSLWTGMSLESFWNYLPVCHFHVLHVCVCSCLYLCGRTKRAARRMKNMAVKRSWQHNEINNRCISIVQPNLLLFLCCLTDLPNTVLVHRTAGVKVLKPASTVSCHSSGKNVTEPPAPHQQQHRVTKRLLPPRHLIYWWYCLSTAATVTCWGTVQSVGRPHYRTHIELIRPNYIH